MKNLLNILVLEAVAAMLWADDEDMVCKYVGYFI